jgi:hypothetical protein
MMVPACGPIKLAKVKHLCGDGFKYETILHAFDHNQQVASCCRNSDEHLIEAFYSTEAERWRGRDPARDMPNPPDIYLMHCTCGRVHRRFCVGSGERPFWDVR